MSISTSTATTSSTSTRTVRAVGGYTDDERAKIASGITSMAIYYPGARHALTAEGCAAINWFSNQYLVTHPAPVVAFAVMNWLENYPGEDLYTCRGAFDGLDMKAFRKARVQAQESERQAQS